ncbi:MAG: serine/threonine protein kinase [Polyangiales bacterium]|jgi:serine/threonine protein kinase
MSRSFRRGSRLGKYRIQATLGSGSFARVYKARDEVEGRIVALKVPNEAVIESRLDALLKEVRIMVRLDHPNILPILNADIVDKRLVIAYPLAQETLASRLQRRMSGATIQSILEDVIDGAAYAHEKRVIHCDINPHNILLFEDGTAKLADFGIAKIAINTVMAGSGSGTVGYLSPDQAMGRPSFRSDVFSIGLIAYRMFAKELPRWPYAWPPIGHPRLRSKVTPEMIAWIRRSIVVDERKRFASATQMARAYERIEQVLR